MKRAEFEHAIRAAASVLDAAEVLVIGSQAPKDIEFCGALTARGLVNGKRLRERLATISGLDDRVRTAVTARIPA